MEVIIPTHNDFRYLEKIISPLNELEEITKIHIVNSASTKKISHKIKDICKSFGKCLYHECARVGKGRAIKEALEKTKEDVLFLDSDIKNFSLKMVLPLTQKLGEGYDLVKANFIRTNNQSNSAFILKEMENKFPGLKIRKPTGGIYCLKRSILKDMEMPESWGIDLSILLQAYKRGYKITEINIGKIDDKKRSEKSLSESRISLLQEIRKFGGIKNAF